MIEINSLEKSDAKAFYILSAVCSFIAGFIIWQAFLQTSSGGIWIAAFFFLIFGILFYCVGGYYRKKFSKLGPTPLFINEQSVHLGGGLGGQIRIDQPKFSKIHEVTLTNMYYRGGDNFDHCEVLNTSKGECQIRHELGVTWLDFEVLVPEYGCATKHKRNKKFYWLLSIEYTEDLSLVKRTWPIEIKPFTGSFNA